jgi:hypothetical protein
VLAELAEGPVVDLPTDHTERWMLAQTCHGRPIAQGINRPFPPEVHRALRQEPSTVAASLSGFGYRWLVIRPQQGDEGEQQRQAALAGWARSEHRTAHDSEALVVIDLLEATP